jgi:hypothetical protein
MGNLTALQVLYVYDNQLRGSIPAELGNLTNLLWLSLRGNQLSGGIPPQLGNLASLQILRLYSNRLTGTLPSQLGDLANLEELLVHENPLSGELPRSLMNLHPSWFYFDATNLCEPGDAAFQAWLAAIPNLKRTGAICRSRAISLPVVFSQFQ